MVDTLQKHDLFICADGAYLQEHSQGSHAWVFSTGNGRILWEGCGPALGLPSLMTLYRAELSGLTSVLFVLHWLSTQLPSLHGTATIYCDNDSALPAVFSPRHSNNNPYATLAADRDLMSLCHDLLKSLPTSLTVKHSSVKGHYKGEQALCHLLNAKADDLARSYNSIIRKSPMNSLPLPPTYEIELLQGHHQ